ncbi:MAG: phosphate ABC transporter permease subunit PstC [Spirochaetales bacterium]|nr:phosphate ABC transporter permease subunit PstC [Spirochaetales bacterium]
MDKANINAPLPDRERGRFLKTGKFSGGLAGSVFRGGMRVSVFFVSFLILAMILSLGIFSAPAIGKAGLSIFTGTKWHPESGLFGGWPFIVGTLLTSILALIISLPFSFAIALALGEYYPHGRLSSVISSAVELLAGIPSIIYGTWGLFVIVPMVQKIQMGMTDRGIVPFGLSIFSAAIVLAIMIIPYSASIAREVILMVPNDLKEAGFSLGSTRFAVIRKVILPYSMSGIFAGQLLAFGRALGETMAVAMVVGNLRQVPGSIFSPGATIASVIASEYNEAGPLHAAALTELGLILFVITIAFGFLGRVIINRMSLK